MYIGRAKCMNLLLCTWFRTITHCCLLYRIYSALRQVPIAFTVTFMFVFPYIITLYYIKNQQDATLEVLFISNCKITLHVSDAAIIRSTKNCSNSHWCMSWVGMIYSLCHSLFRL